MLISYFKIFLRRADSILFMEYLGNRSGDQAELALKLRRYGFKNKLIGLVHLSPSNLKELHRKDSYIKECLHKLDNILVFGTSLEQYFIMLGFDDKVRKTFHYVCTDYYHPIKNRIRKQALESDLHGLLKKES